VILLASFSLKNKFSVDAVVGGREKRCQVPAGQIQTLRGS
jgi:hypothetical protein